MSQTAPQQQQQKAKPKKHRMRSELYDTSAAVAKLKNRKCPRCGSVMAHHEKGAARWVCGSCSFTDYVAK
jgi:ubiquitin-small subunit ribosomal protein S27Ae